MKYDICGVCVSTMSKSRGTASTEQGVRCSRQVGEYFPSLNGQLGVKESLWHKQLCRFLFH